MGMTTGSCDECRRRRGRALAVGVVAAVVLGAGYFASPPRELYLASMPLAGGARRGAAMALAAGAAAVPGAARTAMYATAPFLFPQLY